MIKFQAVDLPYCLFCNQVFHSQKLRKHALHAKGAVSLRYPAFPPMDGTGDLPGATQMSFSATIPACPPPG
jgi:hypothetical protein